MLYLLLSRELFFIECDPKVLLRCFIYVKMGYNTNLDQIVKEIFTNHRPQEVKTCVLTTNMVYVFFVRCCWSSNKRKAYLPFSHFFHLPSLYLIFLNVYNNMHQGDKMSHPIVENTIMTMEINSTQVEMV